MKKSASKLKLRSMAVLISIIVSAILLLISSVVISYMVLSEIFSEMRINLIAKIIITFASFIGARISMHLNKDEPLISMVTYMTVSFSTQILVGVFMAEGISSVFINGLLILLGSSINLLLLPKKSKISNNIKKRYR